MAILDRLRSRSPLLEQGRPLFFESGRVRYVFVVWGLLRRTMVVHGSFILIVARNAITLRAVRNVYTGLCN